MSKIITGAQAVAELWELGIEEIHRGRDKEYFCPSEKWIKEFAWWLNVNRQPYHEQEYDCDDFSIWAVHSATNSLVSAGHVKKTGHLVCYSELTLYKSTLGISPQFVGQGHARCVVRSEEGNWFELEPQNGLYEKFTAAVDDSRTLRWAWL